MKTVARLLLFVGAAGLAMATPVPEIDPGSAGTALALLSGALLLMRANRKK